MHEILPNDANTRETLGPVRVCRFSPDGKMLAKGHDTGVIEVRTDVIAPYVIVWVTVLKRGTFVG